MNASATHASWAAPGCQPAGAAPGPISFSPIRGTVVWPKTPTIAVAIPASTVNHTTHHFRRRRASEIAPSTGSATTTIALAIALALAYNVFDAPRSLTNHTVK